MKYPGPHWKHRVIGWSINTDIKFSFRISSKIKQTQKFQELSKFIIFKTNINPTEYDSGDFQWIGYLL